MTTTKPASLTAADIIVGHTYSSKRPKGVGLFPTLMDDRQVKWTGNGIHVQYDSPTVRMGRNYPTTTMEKFLKWADRDITDEMPKGEWREEGVHT